MILAGHRCKEVIGKDLVKYYYVFDKSRLRARPIEDDDILDEGRLVWQNEKHFEIFLYDFVNDIYFLEEVA
jgi:hypothetical protein